MFLGKVFGSEAIRSLENKSKVALFRVKGEKGMWRGGSIL